MSGIPTLTASLIVKNESDRLERCLASVRDIVDEIVVVDTGSDDNSIDIAKSFGACIGNFAWCDDFAAARNAALEMVKTEWFLQIDADEELKLAAGPDSLEIAFSTDAGASAIALRIVNTAHGQWVKSPRLHRMVPGIHWVRPIHETIVQPGHDDDPKIDASDGVHILHHGYVGDAIPAKIERNLKLLDAHLKAHPDDIATLFYYARENAWAGDYAAGFQAANKLLENEDLAGSELEDSFAVAAWNLLGLGRAEEVVALTKQARQRGAPTVWTEYYRALALCEQQQFTKALEAIDRACSMPYPDESRLALQQIWAEKRYQLRKAIQQALARPAR